LNKDVAKVLLPVINKKDDYDLFLLYIEDRIEILRGFLEREKDPQRVREVQGAIAELRKFFTLREEAQNSLQK
jgi:hypothetical protein